MDRVGWRLQLLVHWCYHQYVGVTPTLRMIMMSRHVYYILLTYICTSCVLVLWIYYHNIYCVVNTLTNTLSNFNDAVCGQGQYVYNITTVSNGVC